MFLARTKDEKVFTYKKKNLWDAIPEGLKNKERTEMVNNLYKVKLSFM